MKIEKIGSGYYRIVQTRDEKKESYKVTDDLMRSIGKQIDNNTSTRASKLQTEPIRR